jgi:hypothetical protein
MSSPTRARHRRGPARGYGRELSHYGIKEFVNITTV